MKTENCLIADFMGWIHHNDPEYDLYEMGNLKFSTSWDCLIPVVEKIKSLDYRVYMHLLPACSLDTSVCDIACMRMDDIPHPSFACSAETLIEATYKAVIEFINYYNKTIK